MAFTTLLNLKTKVLRELDLEEDSLISNDEFINYTHDAVKDMVSEMMKLGHEDRYYTSYAETSLVSGTAKYSLPSDCFAQKVYTVALVKNNSLYPIKRMRGVNEFNKVLNAGLSIASSNSDYKYIFINESASSGVKIQLVPQPNESISNGIKMYYFREPQKATQDADLIDVPEEFMKYIETYVKVECLKKDVGNPVIQLHMMELVRQRQLFIETLTGQTMDQDTTIEQDLSFYEDSY